MGQLVPLRDLPRAQRRHRTVVQALRHLGKDAVDSTVICRIRKSLSCKNRSQLLRDARYTTDWISDAVREIAGVPEAMNHG
jgi:hypothetical protein